MNNNIDEIQQQEYDFLRTNFNLDDIFFFTMKHRVDILFQSDLQYHCYIDFEDGDGSWATAINPLSAMVTGIKSYLNRTGSK